MLVQKPAQKRIRVYPHIYVWSKSWRLRGTRPGTRINNNLDWNGGDGRKRGRARILGQWEFRQKWLVELSMGGSRILERPYEQGNRDPQPGTRRMLVLVLVLESF